MDFSFSAEQEIVRESVRNLLGRHVPKTALLHMAGEDVEFVRNLWKELADLGLHAMLIPEEHEGMGGTTTDMVAIHEELGRGLAPAPFTTTAITAVSLIRRLGTAEQQAKWLPAIASGAMMISLAWLEDDADWMAPHAHMQVEPGNPARLTGTKRVVEFPRVATHYLVINRSTEENTLSAFLVSAEAEGLTVAKHQSLDLTAPVGTLSLAHVQVAASEQFGAKLTDEELRELMAPTLVATCADMIGAAEEALQATISYAKERTQFGKPIGSNQAIKHKIADLFVLLENAKSATYFAAWAVDSGSPVRALAVDSAKAYTSEMAYRVTADALQLHGGIGITWEQPLHINFKRVRRLLSFSGDAQQARDRIGAMLASSPEAALGE